MFFILCSIFLRCFCLSFKLHFLIHLAPLMHHLWPLFISFFLSLFPLDSFVYSWQKGGEYTGNYTGMFRHFYMTHVHILRGINSTLCTFVGGESYKRDAYTKGEKTFPLFCFGLYYTSCILHWLCVGHAFILMLLCFIGCMFGWSFALLYDHCSHFHMIVLVYDQVSHMFHILFTWLHFTCYIILVLLSLDLPWESNMFCASVSGYWCICSKCYTDFRFRCEWVLPLFSNSRLSLESVIGCFVTE